MRNYDALNMIPFRNSGKCIRFYDGVSFDILWFSRLFKQLYVNVTFSLGGTLHETHVKNFKNFIMCKDLRTKSLKNSFFSFLLA